ncbi:toxin-antitoxin system YwqK family antitoxin [Algoriphagus lacus]|nr:T9SS type A sorting domain-containing protein [Algoriphagus lacus]
MSIAGETPSLISGESTIPICESGARLYSISPMQIPNGVNRAASGYEWTIPSGWKFSDGTVSNGSPRLFTSANAFSQSFTPNCSNTTGSVSVRAWTNAEGRGTPHYSNPRVLPITRTPEFVITTPSEVRCGVAFIASVPDLPCVSPSSYVWNLPPGWTMSGSGRTRVIIPSGSTSQTISADIILAGGCVVSTSKSITPLNSGTISGPPTETICVSGNTYTLDNPPTNSTISWTVTPANRVVIASGTGSTAFLIPGSNPGPATLKFTVSGNCNYEVSKFVYSGALQSSDISIQPFDEVGGYPYVCPNGIYVANIGPFNPNYAYEIQVTNGYATPYNNSTTPNSFVININNYTPSQFVDASISARVNNGCGWSAWKTINLYSDPVSCPPGSGCELCLLLAPNPSSHEVMISLDGVEEYEQKTGKKLDEGMFFIYDLDGNLRKSGKIVGKTTVLVNDLPVGQYVVYYQNGKIITQKNLKIEK